MRACLILPASRAGKNTVLEENEIGCLLLRNFLGDFWGDTERIVANGEQPLLTLCVRPDPLRNVGRLDRGCSDCILWDAMEESCLGLGVIGFGSRTRRGLYAVDEL